MDAATRCFGCVLLALAACGGGGDDLAGAPEAGALADGATVVGDETTGGAVPDASDEAPADTGALRDGGALDATADAEPAPDASAPGSLAISAIASVDLVQNTLEYVPVHEAFTVSDPAGLSGLTVSGSTDAVASQVLVSCNGGDCAVDFSVHPFSADRFTVTIQARDDHGAGSGTFFIDVAPRLVTTGADDGPGSLRALVAASREGEVVAFGPTVATVTLATPVAVPIPLTILGPGAGLLAIDATGAAAALETTGDPVEVSLVTIRNASRGIEVEGGTLRLFDSVLTGNAVGLHVAPLSGGSARAQVQETTFRGSSGDGALAETRGGTARIDCSVCVFEGNATGIAAFAAGAGNTATLSLPEGNEVHDNTVAGVSLDAVEVQAGAGAGRAEASIVASPGDPNVVTANAIGVQRLHGAAGASDALVVTPASQVTGNTADFVPAWP